MKLDAQTYWVDHWTTTLEIKIRHLSALSLEKIQRLIEAQHEVVSLEVVKTESLSFPCKD